MKTYYKITIIGGILLLFGVLFSILTPINTLADQIKSVLIVNEEPIDVSVVDQGSSEPETKIVTFFDNECSLSPGDVSPTIEADGYSELVILATGSQCYHFKAELSVDGINWNWWDHKLQYNTPVLHPSILEVLAPKYRLNVYHTPEQLGCPPGCFTVYGYLTK